MPHSLRAKIKGLRYKGIITDKDCDRLCKALDNEGVLDKIRAEIEDLDVFYDNDYFSNNKDAMFKCNEILAILDKYMADRSDDYDTRTSDRSI